jgi:hypothetical protein
VISYSVTDEKSNVFVMLTLYFMLCSMIYHFVTTREQVINSKDRMASKHTRPGEAHDLNDASAIFGFIAVDHASGARALVRHEGTVFEALFGIIEQMGTVRAKFCFVGRVMRIAVNTNHGSNCFYLAF